MPSVGSSFVKLAIGLHKLITFLGWNGKHCTLEGCPGNCNNHGQCKTNQNMEWECWCESGWFGPGCDIHLEQDCSDRKDNDEGEPHVGGGWLES